VAESGTGWLPPVAPERSAPRRGRFGGALAALAAAAAKGKALLLLLPKLKLLTTSGTMLVSVAAYSLSWGWRFAVGFVVLLFVHEMGHVVQLRREGVKASAPVFIPFLGAVVWARELGGNALAEARVGLAGPVLGSLGAVACLPIAWATGSELFRALAFTGFLLNLFNLAPVLPLDGGRAMAAMAPWMWVVGLGLLVGAAIAFPNPVILLIVLFGATETWRRWKDRRAGRPETRAYYRVRPAHRLAVAAVYLLLAASLAYGMHATHLVRTFADA
jgi:Zn-dependent protease